MQLDLSIHHYVAYADAAFLGRFSSLPCAIGTALHIAGERSREPRVMDERTGLVYDKHACLTELAEWNLRRQRSRRK